MTPVPPKRHRLADAAGRPARGSLRAARARARLYGREVFSEQIGQASATKMCRSVIIKGLEALLTESMLTARHYGVEETVLASLSDLLPGATGRSSRAT